MLLSKVVALASVVVYVSATGCNPDCSDTPSPWMDTNYKRCSGSYQVHKTDKCWDSKWNYCEKTCSIEMGVHPEGGKCCPPPTAPPPTPPAPTPPAPTAKPPTAKPPTPAPKVPGPKQPECKGDTTPLWLQFSPQWGYPPKCDIGNWEEPTPSYQVHADFWIEDLCPDYYSRDRALENENDNNNDRELHSSGGGPDYIEHGKIDFSGSQNNKIALPYCVPDDTKIRICFKYSSAPYWVWSELGEIEGPPSGNPCDDKHGGPVRRLAEMPGDDDKVCSEPIGECPKYY